MTILRCTCCGLPWATIVHGYLRVESIHRGTKHVNAIPLEELARLCHDRVVTADRLAIRAVAAAD